jgi:pyridoxal phosphate enzyme (YggS family)
MTEPIASRLAAVQARVAAAAQRCGRDTSDITLVAVSKTVAPADIAAAFDAGQHVFGENRAQELVAHAGATGRDAEWHFIGRLQRNKVRAIANLVSLWQSVDRADLADEIAKLAPGAHVLVQVNIGDEPQKGGCATAETAALADHARALGLRVEGLMAVPPNGVDPRPHFAALRRLARDLELLELSMGMSGDFEVAIEEGATIVRVGSAIFGPRPSGADLRN